jgi:starvation-inducible DNA-binding protein
MTDVLAERVRKVGHLTLHSIGEISRNQRIADNDASSLLSGLLCLCQSEVFEA